MSKRSATKIPSSDGPNAGDAHPYVLAEAEIRAYVESLSIRDLRTIAARFQVVADLTSGAFEESKDRLLPSDLRLIRLIAEEDKSESYRRIMRAIVAGLEQGRHGINAAHLTASAAVGMTFRWSPEYFSALNSYRDNLRRRKSSLIEGPSARGTKRRSVLRVENDQ